MWIKEVIIVEGKTDTQKLKSIFGHKIQTIETKGLSLDFETLDRIKDVNETKGVIIFTDPDGPGKKIREKINNFLGKNVKNAFISKEDVISNKKIGIAEAEEEAIKNALHNLISFSSDNNSLTWKEYLENNFFLPENRKKITNHLNWDSKLSSKTLFKWLNLVNLNVNNIKEILEK